MTRRNLSLPTSGRSASKIIFLLSGEETDLPAAEARALTQMQDPNAVFANPTPRVMIASTKADVAEIEARIAYSRRVGRLVHGEELEEQHLKELRSGTYAVRIFDLRGAEKKSSEGLVAALADRIRGRVSLEDPDAELTVVRSGSGEDYVAVSRPSRMRQNWASRRPRARAFFHPSAIFPKFSRLLVNLTRVNPREVFLDPFCGTGSLLLEANEVGARPVGVDLHRRMTEGAMKNEEKFHQEWLGVVRADSRRLPLTRVDAIATDVPYGRVSTTSGSTTAKILENLINESSSLLVNGRRLVVMHPESVTVGAVSGFHLEEQHRVPVHSKLTRIITVLRRERAR